MGTISLTCRHDFPTTVMVNGDFPAKHTKHTKNPRLSPAARPKGGPSAHPRGLCLESPLSAAALPDGRACHFVPHGRQASQNVDHSMQGAAARAAVKPKGATVRRKAFQASPNGLATTAVRLKFPAKHAKYAKSTRPTLAGEASPASAGGDATSVAGAKGDAFHPAPSAASCVRVAAAVFTCHVPRLSSPRKRLSPARHEMEREAGTKDGAGSSLSCVSCVSRESRPGFHTLPFLPDSND